MREYETTVIIQPEISDEGVQELCNRLDGILEKSSGVRLMYDDQGRRRLAYEIENFQKGRYLMLHFLDAGGVVPTLERSLRLDDSILRFLTVQVDEEVVDVEARKALAAEEVRIREQRAAERELREADEAAARAEREAQESAASVRAAAANVSDSDDDDSDSDDDDADSDDDDSNRDDNDTDDSDDDDQED